MSANRLAKMVRRNTEVSHICSLTLIYACSSLATPPGIPRGIIRDFRQPVWDGRVLKILVSKTVSLYADIIRHTQRRRVIPGINLQALP